MKNTFLNLNIEDPIISLKIKSIIKDLKNNIDFITNIILLSNIDEGGLDESDDDMVSNFYKKAYKYCSINIDNNLNNNTLLNNGETVGELMQFLRSIYK